MRTIEKLLTYKFTDEEIEKLILLEISNGCGAKGRFNFSDFIDSTQNFFGFQSEKFNQLKKDFKKLCSLQHDPRFWEGGNIIDFFIANLEFINGALILLHWTSILRRALVFIILFFGLTIFGFSAFSFGKKKDIKYYLTNH